MKIGTICNTEHGAGVVVAVEFYNRLNGGIHRYGLELENNPFFYSPVFFFEDEVQA